MGGRDSKEFVVLDIETTGLSKHYHKITEIAAVRVKDGQVIEEFQSLVNPECHIPSFITSLTGIDDEMVKDAPTIDKVMPDFLKFLGDSVIVAHNATFDYGFLHENAREFLGEGLSNRRLCTRKLANRLLTDLPSKRLGSICEYLGVSNQQAHRAMGDTMATAEILNRMLSMLEKAGFKEKEDIFRFEKMPKSMCLRQLRSLDD